MADTTVKNKDDYILRLEEFIFESTDTEFDLEVSLKKGYLSLKEE